MKSLARGWPRRVLSAFLLAALFPLSALDSAAAVVAFEQLLADRMRVLGPDHPHTLNTRSRLAPPIRRRCQPIPTASDQLGATQTGARISRRVAGARTERSDSSVCQATNRATSSTVA